MVLYVRCFAACSKLCAIDVLDPSSCGTVNDITRWWVEIIPCRIYSNLDIGEGVEVGLVELHFTTEMSELICRDTMKLCRASFVPRLYEYAYRLCRYLD